MTGLLSVFTIAMTLVVFLGCGNKQSIQRNANSTSQSALQSTRASIDAINFFGRWWTAEQMSSNFNADSPPPKKAYVKLDRWDASSDNEFPHPDLIDITAKIRNEGIEPADFTVSIIGEFRVAPYGSMGIDLDRFPWIEQRSLGTMTIGSLIPKEEREFQFNDINLHTILDKYSGSKNKNLWPWQFKVRISINSPAGMLVSQKDAILDLIPGD